MRSVGGWLVVSIACLLLSTGNAAGQQPLGSSITYQGQLEFEGRPVSDSCNFEFSLWADAAAQSQVGAAQSISGLAVDRGLFVAELDFGAGAFAGEARWLGIAVQCSADTGFTDLSPPQRLSAAPYSIHAQSLDDAAVTTATILDGTILFSDLDQNAAAPGQVMKWTGSSWMPADDFGVAGPLTAVWGADGLAGGGDHDDVTLTLADQGVTSAKLADGAVAAGKIAPNAITAGTIAASAVTAGTIASDAVTAGTVASAAIDSDAIADSSIATADIAPDAITSSEIGAGEVTSSELSSGAVTSDKIAAGAVTSDKIAAGAVTTGKLAASAVTSDKIATAAVTNSRLADDAVTGDKIATVAVGTSHLADSGVTGAKIADGSVALADLAQAGATDGQLIKWDDALPGWAVADDDTGGDTSGWVDDGTTVRLASGTDAVGIGTATPAEKLDVAGTVRVEGFEMPTGAGAGKVLTSGVDGTASWQTPAVAEPAAATAIYQLFRHVELFSAGTASYPLGMPIQPGQARYVTGIWVEGTLEVADIEADFRTASGSPSRLLFVSKKSGGAAGGFWSSGGGAPIGLTEGNDLELTLNFNSGGTGSVQVTVTGYDRPSLPPYALRPTGSDQGSVEQLLAYSAQIEEPEGDVFYYQWDWDDGELSSWAEADSPPTVMGDHTWTAAGVYFVRVRARDVYGQRSDWSSALAVEIEEAGP